MGVNEFYLARLWQLSWNKLVEKKNSIFKILLINFIIKISQKKANLSTLPESELITFKMNEWTWARESE